MFLISFGGLAQTNTSISGTVRTDAGDPLAGATVFLKGTYLGTTTNSEGQFVLPVADASKTPLVLVAAYQGFDNQELAIQKGQNSKPNFTLAPALTPINQVVVAVSRVEESLLQAPVTVEKVTAKQVQHLPSPDLLRGLSQFKGIDVNSAGVLISSLSTRGFNSPTSERLIQLTDYFDTQSPSLSSNIGNVAGLPEIDVESIEVLQGPASALYGANAFNGVLLLNSKDAFTRQGLSVQLRGGQRNLFDGQLRYAQKIGERLAFKLVGSYVRVREFNPANEEPTSTLINPVNNPADSPLGYEAVNRYGSLFNTYSPFQSRPGFLVNRELYNSTVYMRGFAEQTLSADDDQAYSYRIQPALSFLISNSVKATASASITRTTTSYQSARRYRLRDFGLNQYRAELKAANWFVRASSTTDSGGDSYNLDFLGTYLQNSPVADGSPLTYRNMFVSVYNNTYTTERNNGASREAALAAAKAQADATQLSPDDPRFQQLRAQIIRDATPGLGARFNPSSILNDVNGQYNFRLGPRTDLVAGAAYREFRLGSNGNLFADRDDRLRNYEYGAYTELVRRLLDERLKLAVAGRIDAFRNFELAFSPRASAVYSAGSKKQHSFRASFSQAFRSPTQSDQYTQLDLGSLVLLGNVGNGFDGFTAAFGGPGGAPLLLPYRAQPLELERVSTVEVGYKGAIQNKLFVDLAYFRSFYNNFIGARRFIGNRDGSEPSEAELQASLPRQFQGADQRTRIIQVQTNAEQQVRTQGAVLSLTFVAARTLNITGNYSLNLLSRDNLPQDLQSFFNTPKNKYNVGANGQVARRLSYAVNYRWAQEHFYETSFAAGQLSAYSSVDASLGYTVTRLGTTLQAGGSNLLNTNSLQVYGGPNISRIAYVGLLVDIR